MPIAFPEPTGPELTIDQNAGGDRDSGADNVFSDGDAPGADRTSVPDAPAYSEWAGVKAGREDGDYNLEAFVETQTTLADHLAEQLALAVADPRQRMIGRYLIDLVDDSGYLAGDLADVARHGEQETEICGLRLERRQLARGRHVGVAGRGVETIDEDAAAGVPRNRGLEDAQRQLAGALTDFAADYARMVRLGKAVPESADMPTLLVQLQAAAAGQSDGHALYRDICAACHGADGRGVATFGAKRPLSRGAHRVRARYAGDRFHSRDRASARVWVSR